MNEAFLMDGSLLLTAEAQRAQRKRREHLSEAEEVVTLGSDLAKRLALETGAGGGL